MFNGKPDVDWLVRYGQIDVAADWQKVKRRMDARRVMPLRHVFTRVAAAAVALMVTVGAGVYLLRRPGQQADAAYNQIVVPAGQRAQMTLADGTSVWLNAGSSLRVPANFGAGRRQVRLEGEACFEVVTGGKTPFTVLTVGLEIRVYGTSFNVTSYPDDRYDEVALMRGSLGVAAAGGGGNELMLQPGQKIRYMRETSVFAGPVQADAETELAWRDGKLVFDDEPFGEIAKKLERRYGVTVRILDERYAQMRYRGAFRRETLEQAIQAIQFTAGYSYRIEDEVLTIY